MQLPVKKRWLRACMQCYASCNKLDGVGMCVCGVGIVNVQHVVGASRRTKHAAALNRLMQLQALRPKKKASPNTGLANSYHMLQQQVPQQQTHSPPLIPRLFSAVTRCGQVKGAAVKSRVSVRWSKLHCLCKAQCSTSTSHEQVHRSETRVVCVESSLGEAGGRPAAINKPHPASTITA